MNKKPTYEELEQRIIELEKRNFISGDITDHKQAEEALQLQSQIAENMAEGVYLIRSSDGVIVYANSTFERMFGYDPGELIGRHVSVVNGPSEKSPEETAAEIIQSLSETGSWNGEIHNIKKNGETFWCHANVSSFKHPEYGPVWISVHQDITKQKNADEAIRISEEKFKRFFERLPYPLCYVDEDGKITIRNDRFIETFGYTEKDVPSLKEWWIKAYPDKEYRQWVIQNWEHAVREAAITGKDIKSDEYKVSCKDGEVRNIIISGITIENNFMATFIDITDRKRAEEVLEKRVITLTQPLDDISSIGIEDLFNMDDIQHLQDEFALATGVASIITHVDGRPITEPSNFTRLCNDIIRKTEKGCANCFKSDAALGKFNPDGPIIQPCLSGGLWDAGAAISVGGKNIANWLIGQVRDESQTEEKMREYAREIEADEEAFVKAFYEVPCMSLEQFNLVSKTLFTLAKQLSTLAYQTVQQARYITEQKQAEEDLKLAKEKTEKQSHLLDFIFENTLDSIVLLDKDYNFIKVSQSYADACQRDIKEFKGKNHFELYPSDLKDDFDFHKKEKTIYSRKNRPFEFPDHPEWGITYWDLGLVPVFDHNKDIEFFIFTLKDVTEQTVAEEKLKESEERFRMVLQGSSIITASFDTDLRYTWVYNPHPDFNVSELLGKRDSEIDDNEGTRRLTVLKQRTIDSGMPLSEEINFPVSTGERTYTVNAQPVMDAGGKIIGGKSVSYDITMRKQTEREKEELQKQLNHKSQMDAIGQLAGGMAHDFNNVLGGIMNASQLLQLPKHGLNEKSLKYVDLIIQASVRASDLINKLLVFSRKGNMAKSANNIHEILSDTADILKGTVDKKITIALTEEAQDQYFIGDFSAIESAFINLGINASHAMPDGGVIEIKTKNIYLDQKYCDSSSFEIVPGDFIQIEIKDTGSGIPEENLQKIFDPFFTTKEQGKGTGLGLSAVYGTIQDHQGVIEVQSKVGKGTTFYILLPSSRLSTGQVEETGPTMKGSGTILLVDDEEFNRILNKDILESLGYEVILAEDGQEAVEIFSKKHSEIDIVLMDMIMPRMNGSEAFYKVKEIDPNCNVIIASGYSKDENIETLIEDGVKGFVNKPYKISEISQVLGKVKK